MMEMKDELVQRLAIRRRDALGLSENGFAELLLAVRQNPESFIETDADQAFARMVKALERYEDSRKNDDLLDDAEFLARRAQRTEALRNACEAALQLDPECVDARLASIICSDLDPDQMVGVLLDAELDIARSQGEIHSLALASPAARSGGDAWDDIMLRPRLRLLEVTERACYESARYRMADEIGAKLLELAPSDVLGARHTRVLCLARLEDEEGFDALDARLGRQGDCWVGLGRVILLYKLGRMGAARRALRGFDGLCDGGIYAFLRPVLIDTYMPSRPISVPYSFAEATLAVHEADPIVVDAPDLPAWVESQPDMVASGKAFADRAGFDW